MDFTDREDLRLLAERFTYLRLRAENTPTAGGAASQSAGWIAGEATNPEPAQAPDPCEGLPASAQ
jgi:hypothetical protein